MAILSAAQAEARPIPEGYHTVTPIIVASSAAALIDYLKAAFDAEETVRLTHPDGKIDHAEIRIGDTFIIVFEANENLPATPGFFRLYADDDVYQRALEAGGKPVTEMTESALGDRVGRVSDPAGNIWWIQTRLEEVGADEKQAARSTSTDETAPLVAGS